MNNQKNPLVSVVMPAYNAGNFLCESIDSVLNQTYKNIELIIVNDASTDNTSEILKGYKNNKKVKILKNTKNLGVSKSASIAVSNAKGQFVARMDADDIMAPERISKQVEFLVKNKDYVAVGAQCLLIDKNGKKLGTKRFPLKNSVIKSTIFSHVPIQQPTLMVNKKLLPKNFVWYDENYSSAEELELMFKLFKIGKLANLPDILLKYRIHSGNISLLNPKKTFFLTLKTRLIGVLKYGYIPTFFGSLTTLLQAIFVLIIPNNWIYPIYEYQRGMKKITLGSVRIKKDANFLFKKAYNLVQG